ncbi:hypothetical protein ROR02_31440 [Pararhodospirillum oryzae]|uniref:CobE/GbiG C-terminal domain-containing protein n=2 Tax=Pararhodospirillum oryzae TaxID=478448 RepID=A0A512HC40_9PROT|nr:hypothetical protein ROR02_31440 [Pararhodospirillum oryzae]
MSVGVGCSSSCSPETLAALVRATLAEAAVPLDRIACIATLDRRVPHPAVQGLARALGGVPVRGFSPETLNAVAPERLRTVSEKTRQTVGCASVAEAAALCALGSRARLLIPRRADARATCAVATSPSHGP